MMPTFPSILQPEYRRQRTCTLYELVGQSIVFSGQRADMLLSFQVLTAASMKIFVFRDVAPSGLVEVHGRFRDAYGFHLQRDTCRYIAQHSRRQSPSDVLLLHAPST
jgi:hypothetical protein